MRKDFDILSASLSEGKAEPAFCPSSRLLRPVDPRIRACVEEAVDNVPRDNLGAVCGASNRIKKTDAGIRTDRPRRVSATHVARACENGPIKHGRGERSPVRRRRN